MRVTMGRDDLLGRYLILLWWVLHVGTDPWYSTTFIFCSPFLLVYSPAWWGFMKHMYPGKWVVALYVSIPWASIVWFLTQFRCISLHWGAQNHVSMSTNSPMAVIVVCHIYEVAGDHSGGGSCIRLQRIHWCWVEWMVFKLGQDLSLFHLQKSVKLQNNCHA